MTIVHFFRYLKRIFLLSFRTWIQYPADFFVSGIGSIMYTIMQITLFYFMFSASSTGHLGVFSFQEFYLVFIISQWSVSLFFFLSWENLSVLRRGIEQFLLDIPLTKPLSPDIILLLPKVSLSGGAPMIFIQSILSIGLLFTGLPATVHWYHMPLFFYWTILGYLIIHHMVLFGVAIQFFVPGFQGLWKMTAAMTDTVQYPRTLFPDVIQWIFMGLLPFFLIADPIFMLFQEKLTIPYLLLHTGYSIFYCVCSYLFWRYGLRKYGT